MESMVVNVAEVDDLDILEVLEGESFTIEDLLHIFHIPKDPLPRSKESSLKSDFEDKVSRLVMLRFAKRQTTYTLSSDGRKLLEAGRGSRRQGRQPKSKC